MLVRGIARSKNWVFAHFRDTLRRRTAHILSSPPAETIPLTAAAATSEILSGQLRPVVFSGVQLEDLYEFGLLFYDDSFALCKSNPYEGDQHQQ